MDRWIVILILGQFVFLGFIIWVVARAREAHMRRRSEERSRLLERFSSSQELTEFLNSEAGGRLLDKGAPAHPMRSLSGTVTAGIITFFTGVGFLIVANALPLGDSEGFLIPGFLGLMAGIGILISAIVSAILYKRAGLLRREEP